MRAWQRVVVAVIVIAVGAFAWISKRAPVRQSAPVVTVLSRGASDATISRGTPLFLEVFLTGARNTTGLTIGSRVKPWHQEIVFEATLNGHSIQPPVAVIEGPRVRELTSGSNGQPAIRGYQSPSAAVLEGMNRVFHMEVAIGPDGMEQLEAGHLEIVAVLQSPWWQVVGWRGRKESAPVTVAISDQSSDIDEKRLAATAEFFLRTGQPDKAMRAARTWVGSAPQVAAAHAMIGDVLAAAGDQDAARREYERALDLAKSSDSNEPPTAILAALDRLSSMPPR